MNETRRCDFCDDAVADPIHDGVLVRHGAFETQTPSAHMHVDAGAFLACPPCAELYLARDLDELLKRVEEKIHPSRKLLESYRLLYAGIQRNQMSVERITAADMGGPAPETVHVCRHCGQQTRIDASSYERSTSFLCSGCNTHTTLIGKDAAKGASL